ncbi:MgtC/SapB family protein [Nonlabens marinus]|uniref:Uncharacterized protein n=1 Tax=Nonlabens marinus S1-08 TaxID=1454201 RepID=W8VZG0_9FLAO|nr:MgtC/SapB family protein [Nonlabens marinus]BAO54511.1 hypothetical protein NMS_0502 [Nonlabens marinus S1-08]
MEYSDLYTLGIALGLGFLVGFQRQRDEKKMAGVRTYSLITILGTVLALIERESGNVWVLPVVGIGLTALMVSSTFIKSKSGDRDPGLSTEVAALLMYAIGAYLVVGNQWIGVIVGGGVAFLLYLKSRLHSWIIDLEDKDVRAIMTFSAISLIILPVLPDQTYGPYDVLNPHDIWLIVVLIVGISVVGYFLYKVIGKNAGVISNGILGGLISSTATTVSYSRMAKQSNKVGSLAAFVILTASAVSFGRIIVEIGIVAPEQLGSIVLPIAVVAMVMVILSVVVFILIKRNKSDEEIPEPKNPAQFKSALTFGLLYGLILLAVAFAKTELGNDALYVVSVVSGLTDVDAITLSLSQLMKKGSLETSLGWQLIILAGLSNMLFKGIMAVTIGGKTLARWIVITFGITIVAGLLIIWLWPQSWQLSG